MHVGYSNTSPKMIAKELGLSTGNITYYFPTKEHLLSVIVEMLCDFQWRMLQDETDLGLGSAASICLETMTVVVACSESDIARDFFTATFQSELCRNYLRRNHVERAKKIFARECDGWTDARFHQTEILIMGIQYAAVVPNDADIPLKARIASALDLILSIYNVEEETRKREIERVLTLDTRKISKRVFQGFVNFVAKTSEQTLQQMSEGSLEK